MGRPRRISAAGTDRAPARRDLPCRNGIDRFLPKPALRAKIRDLVESEVEELELATDQALGRVEPK